MEYSRLSPKEDGGVFFHIGAALQKQGRHCVLRVLPDPEPCPTPSSILEHLTLSGAFCSGALSLPLLLGWHLPGQIARRFFSISYSPPDPRHPPPPTAPCVVSNCLLGLQTGAGVLFSARHCAGHMTSLAVLTSQRYVGFVPSHSQAYFVEWES